jgi:hypothetical protein
MLKIQLMYPKLKINVYFIFLNIGDLTAGTAIGTKETIRLVIQIPRKTDRSTYSVYEPIPIPTFEDTLGKFVQIYVADERRLAVSVDGSSYLELPSDYRQNCRVGDVTICKGDTPIYERGRKTCFSSLFF